MAYRVLQGEQRPVVNRVLNAAAGRDVEALGCLVTRHLGVDQELIALISGHEMELVGAAPAPLGEVVEAVRRGHDVARPDEESGAIAAPAGIDAPDGAPGVLHRLHQDPPIGTNVRRDGSWQGEK